MDEGKEFSRLYKVMKELRAKCPWDRKQTHKSLLKHLLEETYEVIEAIEEEDDKKLLEELGDLLLQPVFHSIIAEERGAFTVSEMIASLREKLIDRHPHVFGDEDPEKALENWEKRKMENRDGIFSGVPRTMPALKRSQKLQDRASKLGFDFENPEQVFEKIEEEIEELKESLEKGDKDNIEHEIGDILTAVVELARLLGVDAEIALHRANERFVRRFTKMEEIARERGMSLKDMNLEEMDALWEEAKKKLEG